MSITPSKWNQSSDLFDTFPLDLWDPFRTSLYGVNNGSPFIDIPIDWKEIVDAHVFMADLPGVKKEEVKVEVEDGKMLVIRGERKPEPDGKNETWHCKERLSGKSLKRFRLPANAKVEQMKASMENGVLIVTVAKAEVKKPEVRTIEVSGGSGTEKKRHQSKKGVLGCLTCV